MRTTVAFIIAAMVALTGCSESPTGVALASSLTGSWSVVEPYPGASFTMNLMSHGPALSGTGSFVAEAGPGGNSVIAGEVMRDQVNIDFTLLTGFTTGTVSSEAHFTGRLISNQLKGTMQYGVASGANPPMPTTFVR